MAEVKSNVYPVLLAGGTGTRLWPVSRELYPKQLVKFIGNDSLVQSTIKRLTPLLDLQNVRVVCGEQHRITGRLRRVQDPSHLLVQCFHRAQNRMSFRRMPHHIAIGKIDHRKGIPTETDGLDHRVGHLLSAHLRLEIISGHVG